MATRAAFFIYLLLGSRILLPHPAPAQVVINEILYHPPRDRDGLQFIELWNSRTNAVDLAGWSFRRGVKFTFPQDTRVAAGGFAVVCGRRADFVERYGTNVFVAGEFEGRLSHGGERLELADATGRVVDSVIYSDRAPWPLAADGHGASLERIAPAAPGSDPDNWAPAILPRVLAPAGSPGRTNDAFAPNRPPAVREVSARPESPAPSQPITITAQVSDSDRVTSVTLLWRVLENQGAPGPEQRLALRRVEGDDRNGRYEAEIPGQADGRLVRYRIEAVDTSGARRQAPSTNELRPAWSVGVFSNTNTARVPLAFLRRGDGTPAATVFPGGRGRLLSALGVEPARGEDTLVLLPTNGGPARVFDFIQLTPRQGGHKVRLLKDQALDGMTTLNVILEAPRSGLAEVMAYDLYRRAGVPAPRAEHWRVWLDGRPVGWQLVFEQINRSFLARHGRDDSGRLYKLIWYGRGVVGQHEKKTDMEGDHADLLELLEGLNGAADPAAQWDFIARHFNVTNFVNYYAVNMCIQNWDGFFNNYFTYHDTGGTGRWEIYPWDEDKTWGDYDGFGSMSAWYSMPLTFGMNGDQPPGTRARPGAPSPRQRMGGAPWWRAPGWFSGPLLANPEFRQRFLARLRELCQTHFTEATLFPVIDALEQRLEPEMTNSEALAEFRRYIQSFRDQVTHRRQFILSELDKP